MFGIELCAADVRTADFGPTGERSDGSQLSFFHPADGSDGAQLSCFTLESGTLCDWLFYLDADGTQFGPFHARTVRDWIAGGYFLIGDGLPVRLPHWDSVVPIRSLNELLAKVVDAGPAVSQPDDDFVVPPFVLKPHAAPFLPAAPIPGPLFEFYAKGPSASLAHSCLARSWPSADRERRPRCRAVPEGPLQPPRH